MKIIQGIFLGAAIGAATPVQAQENTIEGVDHFICVTETAEGPAALFGTKTELIGPNGSLTMFGRNEEFFGGLIEGGSVYARDESRLEQTVRSYNEVARGQLPSWTTREIHAAQTEQFQRGLEAIKGGTNNCNALIM